MDSNDDQDDLVIAVDLMGGDFSPKSPVDAVERFLKKNSGVRFKLFGDMEVVESLIAKKKLLLQHSEIIHSENIIKADQVPSAALRASQNTSMRMAIEAVKQKQADAVVSSGNTGALMVIAKVILGTLANIDRPAIAAVIPNKTGKMVMLDLGANVDCDADNLMQFALMGHSYAHCLLQIENPKVALLNIGSEDIKGNDRVKYANQLIRENCPWINFVRYVEGDSMMDGHVDVIVTDGFTGNVALKTIEGVAGYCKFLMKKISSSSILSRLGFALAYPAVKRILATINHKEYNGAIFLGLNGIVIKSHGSADATSFTSAINTAYQLAKNKINDDMITKLAELTNGGRGADDNDN